VFINELNYRGNLQSLEIFKAICNSLTNPNEDCQKETSDKIDPPTPPASGISLINLILLTGFLGLVFMSCGVILYERYIKKQLNKEMSQQVNQMVSQYMAFHDQRESLK